MATYTWMIWSQAFEGRDVEYNTWYDNQHIHDVLKIPAVRSGQRFLVQKSQLVRAADGSIQAGMLSSTDVPRYLAIYEIEAEDVDTEFLKEVLTRTGTSVMPITPALDFASVESVLLKRVGPHKSKT